jgi:hypothetical protein
MNSGFCVVAWEIRKRFRSVDRRSTIVLEYVGRFYIVRSRSGLHFRNSSTRIFETDFLHPCD